MFGKTYDRIYDPVGLIQESVASGHPVMYVGVNYRIGCTQALNPYVNGIR